MNRLLSCVFAACIPVLFIGVGGAQEPAVPSVVAAGVHEGDAFGPRLRGDGQWIAYGVEEVRADGTPRRRYFARSLSESGVFRGVWPTQHPALRPGEGPASFTDIEDFQWHPEGRHNVMVARHRSQDQEVLVELLALRLGELGRDNLPSFSPDGSQLAAVVGDGTSRELWVSAVEAQAKPRQLTWTWDEERWPQWHPAGKSLVYELRDRQAQVSDLHVLDLASGTSTPLLRNSTSDEVHPGWSPDGRSVAFLSNERDPTGVRYDLFVIRSDGTGRRRLVEGVVVTETSRGYCWDPAGRFLLAVQSGGSGRDPLVVVRPDGGAPAGVVDVSTQGNRDPSLVSLGSKLRLAWTSTSGPGTQRTVRVVDLSRQQLEVWAGLRR